jgi:hypothetical protein
LAEAKALIGPPTADSDAALAASPYYSAAAAGLTASSETATHHASVAAEVQGGTVAGESPKP